MLIIYTIAYAKQLIKQKTATKIYTIGDKPNKKESERVRRNTLLLQTERDFFFMIFKHFFFTHETKTNKNGLPSERKRQQKKKQTFKKEARQRLAAALFKVETEGIKSGFKDDS